MAPHVLTDSPESFPAMNASTRSISLVLLGSAVFLTGCRRDEDEENRRNGGYAPRVFIGGGSGIRSGGGTSTAPSSGVSARGGFGGTGSSFGGGSASSGS
jgi:hypothetical protein